MRICLISTLFEPHVLGGVEVYLAELARRLAAEHTVSVITTTPWAGCASLRPQRDRRGSLDVYHFYPLNFFHLTRRSRWRAFKAGWVALDLYNWHTRWAVQAALRAAQPDVVHTHNLRGMSLAVWDAVRSLGLPLVHTLHDHYLLCRNSMMIHGPQARSCAEAPGACQLYRPWMRGLAGSKPELVLSPSRYLLDEHQRWGFLSRSRQAVLRFGVSPAAGAAIQPARAEGEPLRLLYIGAVSQHKGVRYLVEAFRRLAAPELRLEIAGSGDDEVRVCRDLAGGDARIAFLGFVDGAEKEALLQRADIIVVPSIWADNSPVVIWEARSRGKALVASAVGGIPELIEDGVTGLLVPPRSVEHLAAALDRLRLDPHLRQRLGEGARAADHGLTVDDHVAQLTGQYVSVLPEPDSAQRVER